MEEGEGEDEGEADEGEEALPARNTTSAKERARMECKARTRGSSTSGLQRAVRGATRPAVIAASAGAVVFLGTVPERREDARGAGRGGKVRLLGRVMR